MHIKEGFVLHNIGDEYMAVATGDLLQDFYGYVRNNETAAYIFELLQQETTEEEIVEAMYKKYGVEKSMIKEDVAEFLNKMRKAGFLCE